MIATGIPEPILHHAWPDIWPLIEPAWRKSDDKRDILAGAMSRELQLWAVWSKDRFVAGIVTRLWRVGTSGELRCHVWLIGGSLMSLWAQDFISKLIPWAKAEGCSAITGNGRRGWSRIMPKLGFHRTDDLDGLPCWRRDI